MKTRTCSLNWAMALCAVAAFSFTAIPAAQARGPGCDLPPVVLAPPTATPVPEVMPRDETAPVTIGTFSGTVMMD